MTTTPDQKPDKASIVAGFALGLAAFSIPMFGRVNSWVSVTIFVVYLVMAFTRKDDIRGFFRSPVFLLIAFHLIVQLLGLLHSPDMKQGLADVERFAFALLLPFLVFIFEKYKVRFGNAMLGFIAGCIGITLYGLGYTLFIADADQRSLILSNGHTYFADVLSLHPFYLSIYLIFILFYIAEKIRVDPEWQTPKRLVLIGAGLAYIIGMVFFLRSQIALLIFVLLVVLYLLIVYKPRAAMLTFLLFGVGLVIYLVDTQRVATIFDTYGRNVSTALDNRHQIWKGAMISIGDAPVFGAGTGGEQFSLNKSYQEIGFSEGVALNYNAHNQYLEFLVRNGIAELAVFVALLVYCFRKARYKFQPNFLFLLFMMMFSLSMIAESFLNVQKGIVFFYFFASVFLFLPAGQVKKTV